MRARGLKHGNNPIACSTNVSRSRFHRDAWIEIKLKTLKAN